MFALYRTVERELGALPGVDGAGAISIPPESTDGNTYTRFIASSRPQRDEEFLMANWRSVTGGFFRALAIPLLRGRLLNDGDIDVNARVALVNRAAAERFWPGQDALGKIVTPYARKDLNFTVVGVVGDVRDVALDTPPDATVYMTGRAWPAMTFMLHTTGAPLGLVPAVRERMRAINPNLPLTLSTLEQTLSSSLGQPRFAGTMLGIFSAVALLLAMMGIFSVTSFSVAQRTREIGIRVALGAQPSDVLRMLMWRGVALAVVGLVVGGGAALACTRVLASLLFAVGATDPAVFVAVTLALGVVAAAATFVAARRATRIDPMVALRQD
jgi:putative ABC transport system permease protein